MRPSLSPHPNKKTPLKFILPLFLFNLLIPSTLQTTDISLLNCPTSYFTNQITSTQNNFHNLGSTLYAAYQTSSHQQSLYNIIIKGDTQQLQQYTTSLQIPFIIVGVIFLIIMTFVIAWCIFSRSCPPWQWTKRDLLIHPYTRQQMKYTLFWMVLITVTLLVLCVLILAQIPSLKTNIEKTKCGLYVAVDTALEGGDNSEGTTNTNTWSGFNTLKNNVGNISSLISSTTTQIGLYFTGDDFLKDDMTVMKTKNSQIYEQYQDAQMISPNPYTTATQISAGFDAPLIDSVFIKTGMGPVNTSNTMTALIDQGFQVTKKLADQAYTIDQSSGLVQDSANTIKSNLAAGQSALSMYIRQIQVFLEYLNEFSNTYMTEKFSQFLYTVQIAVAICLIATMLVLIGAFSTSTFHILECRKMVHIGWLTYIFAYLASLVLLYLFFGLGSISYGYCSYFNNLLNGSQTFSNIKNQNSQNILNKLDTCLFGTGNALESFSIAQQIQTLQQLFVNIKTYQSYMNTTSSQYINTNTSIQTISNWILAIQNYKQGIYIDSNPIQTNQDNPNYAIQQLNLYTHTGGGVPTCSNDRWVWDKTNCSTDGSQLIYTASDQTNGALLTTDPSVLCISFNEMFATTYARKWTQDDFIKRYVQIREECGNAYDNIFNFGMTLISFRDSRINLFQGIQDKLNEILTQNNNFNSLLVTFDSRVEQFSDSTATLKDLVISQSTGIVYTSNCLQLGDKFRDIYTIFCENFMSQIVRMALLSLIMSCLILFAIWTSSLFAVRYSEIERNQRLNGINEEIDSERVISDKQPSTDSD